MDTRAAADDARAGDRAEADTDPLRGPTAAPDLSDAIVAAQSGHELAFRTLYRAVNPGLLRYLRGLVADEAEDVASETWGQIARDLGSFRGDGTAFRGWAATIARHRALDHIRKTRRRPVTTSATDELLERGAPDDTESLALQALATDRAVALIATLPTEMAEAVLLRAVMGLDADTAGQVLGKRAGAVRTAAHRGLRRLAAALTEDAARPSSPPSPPIQRQRMTYRDEPTAERRHWTEATDA